MDPRLNSILELRSRSQRFVLGTLQFGELQRALSWYSFDDEDDEGWYNPQLTVKDLPEDLQQEYLFYVKWRTASERFRNPSWVYGANTEPYGWIDKNAYQSEFVREFRRLSFRHIPSQE